MLKHITCFLLILVISVIKLNAACPTSLVTGLSDTAGSHCEDGINLTQFAAQVTADVDKAEYDLVWFDQTNTEIIDPSAVFPPLNTLGVVQDFTFELKLVCKDDNSISISGGTYTATVFPSTNLGQCTGLITTSNECDATVEIVNQCSNIGLVVEYQTAQGTWTTIPPTFPLGSQNNSVNYRVYYPGGLNEGCSLIGNKTINCPFPCDPADCQSLILIPPVDVNWDYDPISFCNGDSYNLDDSRMIDFAGSGLIEEVNFDKPECANPVWYQNGSIVAPNVNFTHNNTDCEPIVLNYNLEIECSADASVSEPAGSFQATVFPDLNNFFKRPADPCSRQLDITCTSPNILVEYSIDGMSYDASVLLPPLTPADPPQIIYYRVRYINGFTAPTNCPSLESAFTANCNSACPTDVVPYPNLNILPYCAEDGPTIGITPIQEAISMSPEAEFIWTYENGAPITIINGNQITLQYQGDGCHVDTQKLSIRVECSSDPTFSEDGGTYDVIVFPPINASTFIEPTDCNPEIVLNCPANNDLIVEYSVNGAFFTETVPPDLMQNDLLTYRITSKGNSFTSGGCFLEGTYNCNDACKEAGIGSNETLCNSDDTVFGLDQFLTNSDAFGIWTESSVVPSSGAFDAATGRFSPFGQIAGTYLFKYKFEEDQTTGCPADSTIITINIENGVEAEINPAATACNDGGNPTSIDFNDLIIESEVPGTWIAPDNSFQFTLSSTIDFTGINSGDYVFTYNVVKDATDCGTANLETIISVNECLGKIKMPTAFSPNADGLHDFLTILNTDGVESLEFNIFNRWGQRVYHSQDKTQGWDGIFNRVEQEMGVYLYYIKVNYLNGESENVKGNITLVR